MKSSTLLKTDNPYSNYNECVVIFKQLKRQLDIAMNESVNAFCQTKQIPKRNKFLNISMKIILLFALFSFYGCAKAQFDKETVYTIKKGEFYSNHGAGTCKDELSYDVKFNESCVYDIGEIEQADINKLFGFCPIYTPHHIKSARFGWRWYKDSLEIHAYIYDKGKNYNQKITSVKIGEYYTYKLKETNTEYTFKINNIEYVYKKKQKGKATLNLQLYPYFGGNTRSPHEVKIYFKNAK